MSGPPLEPGAAHVRAGRLLMEALCAVCAVAALLALAQPSLGWASLFALLSAATYEASA